MSTITAFNDAVERFFNNNYIILSFLCNEHIVDFIFTFFLAARMRQFVCTENKPKKRKNQIKKLKIV